MPRRFGYLSNVYDVVGTVLLHLYAAALGKRLGPSDEMAPIPAIYIAVPSPFPVLETFITQAAKDYHLDLHYCSPDDKADTKTVPVNGPNLVSSQSAAKPSGGMKQALEVYKSQFPHIAAILVGTRRSDPHGGDVVAYYVTLRSCNL